VVKNTVRPAPKWARSNTLINLWSKLGVDSTTISNQYADKSRISPGQMRMNYLADYDCSRFVTFLTTARGEKRTAMVPNLFISPGITSVLPRRNPR
jgi:hypothetical protein